MKRARLLDYLFVLLLSLVFLMSCSQNSFPNSSNQKPSGASGQNSTGDSGQNSSGDSDQGLPGDSTQGTEAIEPPIQGTWRWMKNGKEFSAHLNQDGKGILHYWQNYGGGLTGYVNIKIVNWGYNTEKKTLSITVEGKVSGLYSVDYLTESSMKLSKIKGQHDIGFGLTDSELTR